MLKRQEIDQLLDMNGNDGIAMVFTKKDFMESSAHLSEDGKELVLIDQRTLPGTLQFLHLKGIEEITEAIKTLAVRGAPAIGIAAAYGFYVRVRENLYLEKEAGRDFLISRMKKEGNLLISARPTAVNLSWAVKRMEKKMEEGKDLSGKELLDLLRDEAMAIHLEDMEMCFKISEYGLSLLKDGEGIITHCNAGPLATSKYGTALGPILLGKERGLHFHVFADETRPLLQGARLTTYELDKAGVDVRLICDNMASLVMKKGWVQACLVGCDRIAANGDFANKIGTSGLAILAHYYGIPFYTLGPASTVDLSCPSGDFIPIEERDPDEIKKMWYQEPMAPEGVRAYNPSFDVTDHSLVTAIITDRGILRPPFEEKLRALFN